MLDQTTAWTAGQRAVIGRLHVVTIDRVTPGGRAIVGERTFNPNGYERGKDPYRSPRLEPLTSEIEEEMRLVEQGADIGRRLYDLIAGAEKWRRGAFAAWGRKVPDAADVEKGERLYEAIKAVLG